MWRWTVIVYAKTGLSDNWVSLKKLGILYPDQFSSDSHNMMLEPKPTGSQKIENRSTLLCTCPCWVSQSAIPGFITGCYIRARKIPVRDWRFPHSAATTVSQCGRVAKCFAPHWRQASRSSLHRGSCCCRDYGLSSLFPQKNPLEFTRDPFLGIEIVKTLANFFGDLVAVDERKKWEKGKKTSVWSKRDPSRKRKNTGGTHKGR